MADVYYSASKDALERAIRQRKGSQELRMFLGHSGWAAGQLDMELARGDWLVVQADPRTVFDQDLEHIWPQLIEQDPGPGMIIDKRHPSIYF
jgi:putative transcriptional regulator